ncbi:tRNA(m5U54)methyltransferase [Talaromyces stipitatus ATCC 10500]|uniref:tRNA(M5U54)methyltransferase n=1 Tax=Talaromyces stipitatus (strain ATCC 10500 / CBS 375.48 / QM 6759 / NRRL 1006) TaxID=441959 RepID=B8LTI7_TALSN|nr:tRNA(m5U54)methyltransferase [Talaromyces stipitatus ATCC 10500]EED23065.1 tRNA(m5U54)methyltransferase [Talaromyces stipitatus ATCC 10500]
MFRPRLSVLQRPLRFQSSHVPVSVRAYGIYWSPNNANSDPIESKIASYLRNIISPNSKQHSKKKRRTVKDAMDAWDAGERAEQNLQLDCQQLLERERRSKGVDAQTLTEETTKKSLPEPFTEIELTVSEISSGGDGLAVSEDGNHVYVVPFTVPGDKVLAKIIRHHPKEGYTITDFLEVIDPGPKRDDTQIKCQYFGKCSGCQLQMLSYKDQLEHKKRVVEKAYANFSGLIPEVIPPIGDTFPSPLQYGYRTKLTPHFGRPGRFKHNRDDTVKVDPEVPPIGFNMKNQHKNMDIEDCPLGTDIVRLGLKKERQRVAESIAGYTQGATILLRESTRRIPISEFSESHAAMSDEIIYKTDHPDYVEEKRYVRDHNGYVVEWVDDYELRTKAGAFFQNNNSILSGFTEFMRQNVHPKELKEGEKPIKYLIDAYSGCGLFTVTLSQMFKSSLGIDIDVHSIENARENAKHNNLPNTGFAAADASLLFSKVPYPPDETLIVIDPPRKGCSKDFLQQLLDYGPRRVAYVSCNVHTQARDVGFLVQNDSPNGIRYEIESIRGFDFFPQTGHVEGLAILNKVVKKPGAKATTPPATTESKTEGAATAVSVEKEV